MNEGNPILGNQLVVMSKLIWRLWLRRRQTQKSRVKLRKTSVMMFILL